MKVSVRRQALARPIVAVEEWEGYWRVYLNALDAPNGDGNVYGTPYYTCDADTWSVGVGKEEGGVQSVDEAIEKAKEYHDASAKMAKQALEDCLD